MTDIPDAMPDSGALHAATHEELVSELLRRAKQSKGAVVIAASGLEGLDVQAYVTCWSGRTTWCLGLATAVRAEIGRRLHELMDADAEDDD